MEDKHPETIKEVVQRLIYHSCPFHEDIAGFQLTDDEKYPVILSSKAMKANSKTMRPDLEFVSFSKFASLLNEAYLQEQLNTSSESETVEKCKAVFENLKKSVLALIDNIQKKLFAGLSPKKKTIEFLEKYADGELNESSALLLHLEALLRFYSSEPSESLLRRTVEKVDSFAEEVMEQIEKVVVKYEDIERPVNGLPSIIIDSKAGFGFLSSLVAKGKSRPKFELLFRGSRDGFSASKFHSLTDNKGPTVTLVKTVTSHIFGGYASVTWEPGKDQLDEKAFLFSWNNKEAYYQTQNFHAAVRSDLNYGPFFGFGPQFRLTDNCNKNNSSIMKVDNEPTFSLAGRDRDSVTGSFNFTVSDYEVFLVNNG